MASLQVDLNTHAAELQETCQKVRDSTEIDWYAPATRRCSLWYAASSHPRMHVSVLLLRRAATCRALFGYDKNSNALRVVSSGSTPRTTGARACSATRKADAPTPFPS